MKTTKRGRSKGRARQTEQKKDTLLESEILTSKEKKWLKNNNSKLKCKIIRQYLTEDNILKWKPIPKTSKKTLKKLISKTLLSSLPDDNEVLKNFLVLENTIYKNIDDIYAPKEEIIPEHLAKTNDELVKQIEQNLKEIKELQEMKNK